MRREEPRSLSGRALAGIEGILLSRDRAETLVVGAFQRSLAVRIAGYQVEALPNNPQSFAPMRRSSRSSFHGLTGHNRPKSQVEA
jgi:hypothetical protein